MSERVRVEGFAHAVATVRTVGDLRELVTWLDAFGIDDAVEVEWGSGVVYVAIADNVAGSMVECGDHHPGDPRFDVVLSTHVDSKPVPTSADTSDSPDLAAFDWPGRDRSARLTSTGGPAHT